MSSKFNYNTFRSYLKGRGFKNTDFSILWQKYKEGVLVDLDDHKLIKFYLTESNLSPKTKFTAKIESKRRKSPRKLSTKPKLTTKKQVKTTQRTP